MLDASRSAAQTFKLRCDCKDWLGVSMLLGLHCVTVRKTSELERARAFATSHQNATMNNFYITPYEESLSLRIC